MMSDSMWTVVPKDRLNGYSTHLVLVGTFSGFMAGLGTTGGLGTTVVFGSMALAIGYFGLTKGVNNKFPEFADAEQDFIDNQEQYIRENPERFKDIVDTDSYKSSDSTTGDEQ